MMSKSENSDDHDWFAGHIRYDEHTLNMTAFADLQRDPGSTSVGYALRPVTDDDGEKIA
jgi:hypothetical protein